jgi:formylglycine-generating enzyme required for sulfatase activity
MRSMPLLAILAKMNYIKILPIIVSLLVFTSSRPTNSVDPPQKIIRQLIKEKNNTRRMDLILRLAAFDDTQLTREMRNQLISLLLQWYRDDPHPGLHATIDYLFRNGKIGDKPRKLDWKLRDSLIKIDKLLCGTNYSQRKWYVTKHGQTLVIIDGPVTFQMGSPLREPDRDEDELQHLVHIPRSFAIANKEVTVAEFQLFLDANPAIKAAAKKDPDKDPTRDSKRMKTFSPEDDCPQIMMTWYEATQYCNWLSKEEGIPESEWCYPILNESKGGMEMPKNYLHRTGYRLPTEAEWEFACRAGSATSRFYGHSDRILEQYAWYSKHPKTSKNDTVAKGDPKRTFGVGQLLPNGFGLFDVYGNVWEWCQSRRLTYRQDRTTIDKEDDLLPVSDTIARVRRGGAFSYGKDCMRSAHRGTNNAFPNQRRDNVGFRIARTLNAR